MEDFKEVLFKMDVIAGYIEAIIGFKPLIFLTNKGDLIIKADNVFGIVNNCSEFPSMYDLGNYIIENIGLK